MYRKAGADIITFDALESIEQMKRVATEIDAPSAVSMVPGGLTPNLSCDELQEMGFNLVVYPTFCTCLIAKTVKTAMETIYKNRSLSGTEDMVLGLEEYNELVGLSEIREKEEKYKAFGEELAADFSDKR